MQSCVNRKSSKILKMMINQILRRYNSPILCFVADRHDRAAPVRSSRAVLDTPVAADRSRPPRQGRIRRRDNSFWRVVVVAASR